AFRRVALTVFLTEQLAQRAFAEASFMRRAGHRVIPNGVDCDLFRPDEAAGRAFRRRHDLGDGPVLLGVGALEIEKRWGLLLDSVARLAPPAPPLVLCGTGALEGSLRAQAERLGLDVRFVGQLDSAELVGAYNAATCVVHTRPDEVFALALIEALACGRPVLAAGGGGTPELLGAAGVLAPAGDPTAFGRLLQDLLGDHERRAALALAARRRAVERYSVERMVRDYAEVVVALEEVVTHPLRIHRPVLGPVEPGARERRVHMDADDIVARRDPRLPVAAIQHEILPAEPLVVLIRATGADSLVAHDRRTEGA